MKLKRLGELAKEHQVLPSQIRYYIKEGLLSPSERTRGGFMLFSSEDEERLKLIFEMKQKRLTINEIRTILSEKGVEQNAKK